MLFRIFLPNVSWACFFVKLLPFLGLFFKFACLFLQNNLVSLMLVLDVEKLYLFFWLRCLSAPQLSIQLSAAILGCAHLSTKSALVK